MPDEWEKRYNLNPLVSDASTDSDKDGFTNLDEYKANTDPNDPASKPAQYSSGIFTVDETGIVKTDWLYDCGKFQGEFGIFNLAGMDAFTPSSSEFIAEAVKRVLSDSDQGYVVFSDLQEGAIFRLARRRGQRLEQRRLQGLEEFQHDARKPVCHNACAELGFCFTCP